MAQAMRPPLGQGEQGETEVSEHEPIEKIDIFFELPPSAEGTYQYERQDASVVHGDASGEWTLDEHGDVEDIVFFASPRELMKSRRRGLAETGESGE